METTILMKKKKSNTALFFFLSALNKWIKYKQDDNTGQKEKQNKGVAILKPKISQSKCAKCISRTQIM